MTLQELLENQTESAFSDRIREVTDMDSWTPENKNKKMEEFEQIIQDIASTQAEVLKKLLSSENGGKCLAEWVSLREGYTEIIKFLGMIRSYLDETDSNPLPVDHEWCTKNIREYVKKVKSIDILTGRALPDDLEIEEV